MGIISTRADMAQLVEHHLAKVGVAGSNPVVRSICLLEPVAPQLTGSCYKEWNGDVAKW